jgi:hypothetical protein
MLITRIFLCVWLSNTEKFWKNGKQASVVCGLLWLDPLRGWYQHVPFLAAGNEVQAGSLLYQARAGRAALRLWCARDNHTLERVGDHAFPVLTLERKIMDRRSIYAGQRINQGRGTALLVCLPEAVFSAWCDILVGGNHPQAC